MALGGGTFTSQNKLLPGAYINFVSAQSANSNASARGTATMALALDWGADGQVFEITEDRFYQNSEQLLGYEYQHEKLKGLRDLFKNATRLYAYRVNSGDKAENDLAVAKCSGIRGNDLKIVVAESLEDATKFDVSIYLGAKCMTSETVAEASALGKNDWVDWKDGITLAKTAGLPLAGGTNGTETNEQHLAYLSKMESYSFDVLALPSIDDSLKAVYAAYVKRLRETIGMKFQCVLYRYTQADYEGVISVKNTVEGGDPPASLVYWVSGAQAACPVHKSTTHTKYDGEYKVAADLTQTELVRCISEGSYTFHRVGHDIHVLLDINSFVSVSEQKRAEFCDNQTIRVLDYIAAQASSIFINKYYGKITNNAAGRIGYWSELVQLCTDLQALSAIDNFEDADVVVEQGKHKKSVVVGMSIQVLGAMEKLYMTVEIA